MDTSSSQSGRSFGFTSVAAVLVGAFVFGIGLLLVPVSVLGGLHQIVPETAASYNETVEQAPSYRYSELSPIARTCVDRTRTAPDNEYTPVVCQGFVVTCDEYTEDDLPEEFTYGEDLRQEEASVVIQDGTEQFLLETGMVSHGWFADPIRLFTAWLTMFPLAILVGVVALTSKSERQLADASAAGALVGGVAVAAPYIEMGGVLQARTIGFLLLGSVWIGLLAVVGYGLV
ncbi:MAG: hypothetical protein ACI9YT_000146 [Halobacteriales archaeon]|jgi:hypothetical protein